MAYLPSLETSATIWTKESSQLFLLLKLRALRDPRKYWVHAMRMLLFVRNLNDRTRAPFVVLVVFVRTPIRNQWLFHQSLDEPQHLCLSHQNNTDFVVNVKEGCYSLCSEGSKLAK